MFPSNLLSWIGPTDYSVMGDLSEGALLAFLEPKSTESRLMLQSKSYIFTGAYCWEYFVSLSRPD
jgi:hypothetical protein